MTMIQRTVLLVASLAVLVLQRSSNHCVTAFVVARPISHSAAVVTALKASAAGSSSSNLDFFGSPHAQFLLPQQLPQQLHHGDVSSHLLLVPSSSVSVSAITLDPTTVLSDIFSGVLGTPLILALPIVTALAVASLIAYAIVSYASPAEEDD